MTLRSSDLQLIAFAILAMFFISYSLFSVTKFDHIGPVVALFFSLLTKTQFKDFNFIVGNDRVLGL